MAKRSKARRRALEILFEAEQRGGDPLEVLRRRRERADMVVNDYTVTLVQGVSEEQERLDELISTYARGWTLDRMPRVDVMALRLGAWELLSNDDVPDGVAVAEAVALVREMSTDESPSFVNGLLGRLQQLKPTLE
ncbi:transcription antitermination factor NusB [Nesterenkonia sp. F]|uniref:transcription antitermination factor NusB n=1 Tax=Nesterenkonia sp. F TaxID=795955 RepID=UPI000255D58C|nr:transcription antitermination factor NusB [Nesterenkonia sp. F]